MSRKTERMLSCLANAFMQGRIAYVTQFFVYPLPLYREESLTVLTSAPAFAQVLEEYRDAVLKMGATQVRPRVVAQGLPKNGYTHSWVEWDHLGPEGRVLCTNQVRYATHMASGALYPRVELIDYTVSAFPELFAETSAA